MPIIVDTSDLSGLFVDSKQSWEGFQCVTSWMWSCAGIDSTTNNSVSRKVLVEILKLWTYLPRPSGGVFLVQTELFIRFVFLQYIFYELQNRYFTKQFSDTPTSSRTFCSTTLFFLGPRYALLHNYSHWTSKQAYEPKKLCSFFI